jgi:hypothetical protein
VSTTIGEAISIVKRAGFEVVKAYYSIVNDLTLIDADSEEHLDISSFKSMAKAILGKLTEYRYLKALSMPHSKAEAKPETVNISRCSKGLRTNNTSTIDLGDVERIEVYMV